MTEYGMGLGLKGGSKGYMPSAASPPLASGPIRTSPTLLGIQRGASITFEELITTLYAHRYTGIVTCDFRRGRPVFYSVGKPRRGNIVLPP